MPCQSHGQGHLAPPMGPRQGVNVLSSEMPTRSKAGLSEGRNSHGMDFHVWLYHVRAPREKHKFWPLGPISRWCTGCSPRDPQHSEDWRHHSCLLQNLSSLFTGVPLTLSLGVEGDSFLGSGPGIATEVLTSKAPGQDFLLTQGLVLSS